MPRPRIEPVLNIHLKLTPESKDWLDRESRSQFVSPTVLIKQLLSRELDEPPELFAANYRPERLDGATAAFFFECPRSLFDRVGRIIGENRPTDVGYTISRVVARLSNSPLAV